MSSSGLRGLSEDGTTTEQNKYNSDARHYCIGDFENGDLRMKLTSESVLYSRSPILPVLTCGSSPPLLVNCTNPFIYLFLRCPFLPFPGKIQLGLHNLLRYQQIFASNSQYYSSHAFRHVSSQQTQLSSCKR